MTRRFPALPVLLATLFAMTCVPALAAAPAAEDTPGEKHGIAQRPNEDHKGAFSALLHIVTAQEAERFVHEWNTTATEHAPTLQHAERARRGEQVMTMLLYAGCAADLPAGSACPARVDLKVLAPDGSVYADHADLPLADGIPTAAGVVQLSPVGLGIRFEPEDALGLYRVQAKIRDPARELELNLEARITLEADAAGE